MILEHESSSASKCVATIRRFARQSLMYGTHVRKTSRRKRRYGIVALNAMARDAMRNDDKESPSSVHFLEMSNSTSWLSKERCTGHSERTDAGS